MPSYESIDSAYATTRMVRKSSAVSSIGPSDDTPRGGLRTRGYTKSDHSDQPLMTVVTVVLNSPDFLRDTIHSVIYQNYDNIEYIVVDGGSTDGETLRIIKEYEHTIDLWISEPDRGIYNAMNKSLDLVTGTYVNFLNADDHFFDSGVISRIVERFRKTQAQIVYGDTFMLNRTSGYGWLRLSNVGRLYYLFKGIPQQAFFYDRNIFEQYGRFSEGYEIVSDFDFFLKMSVDRGVKTSYFHTPVVIFGTGQTSSDAVLLKKERDEVLPKYYSSADLMLLQNEFVKSLACRNDLITRPSLTDKLLARFSAKWFSR